MPATGSRLSQQTCLERGGVNWCLQDGGSSRGGYETSFATGGLPRSVFKSHNGLGWLVSQALDGMPGVHEMDWSGRLGMQADQLHFLLRAAS